MQGMRKIAFCGIPSGGKTVLLAEVRKILGLRHRVVVVDDVGLQSPFDVEDKGGFPSQFYYLTAQLHCEHLAAAQNPEMMLCDRSVLDQWVYWKKTRLDQLEDTRGDERITERDRVMECLYRFGIRSYDLLVHVRADLRELPARWRGIGPGVLDQETLAQIETLYVEELTASGAPVWDVWNNLSVDEAAQAVVEEISRRRLF
jgi:hypothetical protein